MKVPVLIVQTLHCFDHLSMDFFYLHNTTHVWYRSRILAYKAMLAGKNATNAGQVTFGASVLAH